MQLYTEEKDWAKLVEVVLRLADFVEDPKQRAKYMHTAAIVASRQLGDVDQALAFYDRALEFDPTLVEGARRGHRARAAEGRPRRRRAPPQGAARAGEAGAGPRRSSSRSSTSSASSISKFLNEPELAIDAYEAAQTFDPDERERARDRSPSSTRATSTQYLDKAVTAQAQILRRNPYRVESYKLLRQLYTEAKRADAAWCLCQALSVLNLAEPDEERFYRRQRAENAAPAQAASTTTTGRQARARGRRPAASRASSR